jgi:hypothetical protein
LNFLRLQWQRAVFCALTALNYSGCAMQLLIHGAVVALLGAVVAGAIAGRTLRSWADRQPLLVTVALLLSGLGVEQQQPEGVRPLADMAVGAMIISALWPKSGGRKRRAVMALAGRLTRRWSHAIPISSPPNTNS